MVERLPVKEMVPGSSPGAGALRQAQCRPDYFGESVPCPSKSLLGKITTLDRGRTAQESRPIARVDGTPNF